MLLDTFKSYTAAGANGAAQAKLMSGLEVAGGPSRKIALAQIFKEG